MRVVALGCILAIAGCEHEDELVPAPALDAPISLEHASIEMSGTEREPAPPRPAAAPAPRDARGIPAPLRHWFVSLAPDERDAVRSICRMRRADPCAGMIPRPKGSAADPAELALASLSEHGRQGVDDFCTHRNRGFDGCDTPLVAVFDGAPIELAAATGARFAFTPGDPVATDWPTARTPWIALDRDGDGAITSGAELFGDSTRLPDGTTAAHGFAALASLDDNGDGTIDWRDRAFTRLVLWADDGDRTSAPHELTPLASVITAIPLAYEVDARCADGNCEGSRSTLHWRDASGAARTGAVVDLYLRSR